MQLLFYSNAVPVSSRTHADLYIKMAGDYGFARSVNSVPLTAVEFRRATPEYAVVFAGEGDTTIPVAILGSQADQNLFVRDDSSWDAKYIPAFVRRYPFVFASSDNGQTFTLCVDDGFSGCNHAGRGERLFDSDGERTRYLETVLSFLNEYQAQFRRTRAFCTHLNELGLLESMQAQFTLPGGQRKSLTGFKAVNRSKLKELDDEVLARMAKNDELELVYLHLHSMQNFDALLRRIGAKPESSASAEGDTSHDEVGGDGAPPMH